MPHMSRLQLTLRGIRKLHSSPTLHRLPLTADMLHKVGHAVHKGMYGVKLDSALWAAICLGFFGALRCGEFTVSKQTDREFLRVNDIVFKQDIKLRTDHVVLNIRSSKTDPFRQGCHLVLFATGKFLCPYTAIRHHLAVRHWPPPHAPLLSVADELPLTKTEFLNYLHGALTRAGLSQDGISGHSLRKGFATSAAAAGIEDNLISTMGRWKSDCYKLYIRTPLSTVLSAQRAIADPKLCSAL